MAPVPVIIDAMGWVDIERGVYLRWWPGETPRPTGFKLDFQVAECQVAGKARAVIVVWAHPPASPPAQRAALQVLRGHFRPETLISLVDERGEGWSRQSPITPADSAEARRAVAMAVAVVQASWGWDESSEIRVEDAAGCVFACPTHAAGAWVATASNA